MSRGRKSFVKEMCIARVRVVPPNEQLRHSRPELDVACEDDV